MEKGEITLHLSRLISTYNWRRRAAAGDSPTQSTQHRWIDHLQQQNPEIRRTVIKLKNRKHKIENPRRPEQMKRTEIGRGGFDWGGYEALPWRRERRICREVKIEGEADRIFREGRGFYVRTKNGEDATMDMIIWRAHKLHMKMSNEKVLFFCFF